MPEAQNTEGNKTPSWFSWSTKSRFGSGVQEPAFIHLQELLVKLSEFCESFYEV